MRAMCAGHRGPAGPAQVPAQIQCKQINTYDETFLINYKTISCLKTS